MYFTNRIPEIAPKIIPESKLNLLEFFISAVYIMVAKINGAETFCFAVTINAENMKINVKCIKPILFFFCREIYIVNTNIIAIYCDILECHIWFVKASEMHKTSGTKKE